MGIILLMLGMFSTDPPQLDANDYYHQFLLCQTPKAKWTKECDIFYDRDWDKYMKKNN